MISLSYVNGGYEPVLLTDPCILLENTIMESERNIHDAVLEFQTIHSQYMLESEILGELDVDKKVYLEAGGENIFKKIGDAIIALFKKFKEMAKTMLDKITSIGLSGKSDTEKLEKLLKAHPDLREQAISGWEQGYLSVSDARSLKDLETAFDEMVKLSKQEKIRPDSLRGKLTSLKKKANEKIDASTIVKVAGATATVVTAGAAIVQFRKHVADTKKSVMDCEKKAGEQYDELLKAIKYLQTHDNGQFANDNLTKAEILHNAHCIVARKRSEMISSETKKVSKMQSLMNAFVTKIDKQGKISNKKSEKERDERNKLWADVSFNSVKNKEDAKKEKKKAVKQKAAETKATTIARNKADRAYYNKHSAEIDDRTRKDAKQRQYGVIDANEYNDTAYKNAERQRQAQHDVDNLDKNKKKPSVTKIKIVTDDEGNTSKN